MVLIFTLDCVRVFTEVQLCKGVDWIQLAGRGALLLTCWWTFGLVKGQRICYTSSATVCVIPWSWWRAAMSERVCCVSLGWNCRRPEGWAVGWRVHWGGRGGEATWQWVYCRQHRRIVGHYISPPKAAFSLPWTNDSTKPWIHVPLTHNTACTSQFSLTLRPPYLWVGHRAVRRCVEETYCAHVGCRNVIRRFCSRSEWRYACWLGGPWDGANSGLWVLKLVQFLGPPLGKWMQSYELKIKYESEYLEWEEKSQQIWNLTFNPYPANVEYRVSF